MTTREALPLHLVREFIREGVVVIPNVVDAETIQKVRIAFHASLKENYEVDVSDLHNSLAALSKLSTTGGAGGEDLLTFMKIYCIILSPSFIYHFQVFSIFFTMIGSFL